jgi:ADP-heptose:LPS heptosyltransferase
VKKEHVLVIRFSAMGDVAMMVPVVYSLAHQYPDVRFTVLSRAFARPMFEGLAPNVNFMMADLKLEYRGIKGLNALYRRLAAKQFTAVADLHNVLRSEYLRLRFNIGHYRVAHINKHRKGRKLITSKNHKQLEQQPTSFENYVEVFQKLGYPVDIQFHSIFPPEGGPLHLLPPPVNFKNTDEEWIGIAPFAAHKGKVYPPELMEQVISQLLDKHPNLRIFLFGRGEQEDQWFSQWCERYWLCTNAGEYAKSLQQELILMSHLDLMVSMDSSNMHLASLTGTPVVSIWGATHPYAGFLGWGQKEENIIQTDLDCRPCSIFGQKPCRRGDYACLYGIRPETIVEKINTLLQTKQK